MKLRNLVIASLTLTTHVAFGQLAEAQTTTRISVNSSGIQANFSSYSPAASSDGRYVAFDSDTTNLVPGDTNNSSDVFVRDRQTNLTSRISVSSSGVQGDNSSWFPTISSDGRFVAFWSSASNLVSGDTNAAYDVFVHDRQLGVTSRVSVGPGGTQGSSGSYSPSLSADGRYVSFWSYANDLILGDTNGWADVFVHDRQLGLTTRVSVSSMGDQGTFASNYSSISANGRYVAFESGASNLVPGDDPLSNIPDIFVHDRVTLETTRVSESSSGVKGISLSIRPAISADGRFVTFESGAPNLVTGDTNNASDIFLHDRQTLQTTRVSLNSSGAQADYISGEPSISADGRYIAFASLATNLVTGDTNDVIDIFVRDRKLGLTTRASLSTGGIQGNNGSTGAAISADGRYVGFESVATNLVLADTNGTSDVFVRDSGIAAAWTNLGFSLAGASGSPQLSASGDLIFSGSTSFFTSGAASSTVGALVLGLNNLSLPLYGGVLIPSLDLLLWLGTDTYGQSLQLVTWPPLWPSGLSVYAQTWMVDAGGVQGFAATNAVRATSP